MGDSPSVAKKIASAGLAGAIGGFAAGAIDLLWSWQDVAHHAQGLTSLCALLLAGASYSLFAGIICAALVGCASVVASNTRLGRLRFSRSPGESERAGVGLFAWAVVFVPSLAGSLTGSFAVANHVLAGRKHFGLVLASSMAITIIGLATAVVATAILARALEAGLDRACRRPSVRRWLGTGRATLLALGVSSLACVASAHAALHDTLSLVNMRPVYSGLLIAILSAGAVPGAGLAAEFLGRSTRRRRLALVGVPMVLLAVVLATGASEGARKSASAYTGLTSAWSSALRAVVDFDRDGFSAVLGGGDCDDLNSKVHPRASDVPGDGIDQNCLGGDRPVDVAPYDPAFAELPEAAPARPNVILITIDTLRSDHVGAYGYRRDTTPNLDRLAARGTLFANSWAHAPSTRYSVPAILTGRYPLAVDYDHSVRGWPGLSVKNQTLAEVIDGQGYATGAILNYWYFARERSMNQGFDSYDNHNQRLHGGVAGAGPARTRGSSSRQQTDKAIEFIGKHQSEPFFLWVHYYDPHYEYEKHSDVPDFGDRPMDVYDNEIAYTDKHIGRLLDEIKRRQLTQRTVIAVTGDHGEGFGEHGIDLHGYHLYAAQTRIPMIISAPGFAPRTVKTPVGHIDILPTLANLVSAHPDPAMMGRSMVDVMAGGPELEDRIVYQQLSYEGNHEHRGAASADCHVLFDVSPETQWRAYQVSVDPEEKIDVSGSGRCAGTRRALERWYDRSETPRGADQALRTQRPTFSIPAAVDIARVGSLLGLDLSTSAARGTTIELTLNFAAMGAVDDSWRVFVHFEGPRGHRFAADHRPTRPFSWWRPGQFIRYSVPVSIPRDAPPGQYTMHIGLFRGAERMPLSSQDVPISDHRAQVAALLVR